MANYIVKPAGILKVLETVFVVITFGILRGAPTTFAGTVDEELFGTSVLVTAMIVTPLLLVCYLMGRTEIQKAIFEPVFNALMFIFILSAGSVAINNWTTSPILSILDKEKSKGLAMGSLCIITSFMYLADAVLAGLEFKKDQ